MFNGLELVLLEACGTSMGVKVGIEKFVPLDVG